MRVIFLVTWLVTMPVAFGFVMFMSSFSPQGFFGEAGREPDAILMMVMLWPITILFGVLYLLFMALPQWLGKRLRETLKR